MKPTGVSCAYGEPPGFLTTPLTVLASGVGGRLFSVTCLPPSGNVNLAWGYKLQNGSGGDVLLEARFTNAYARGVADTSIGALGMAPVNIPGNGIFFTDGIVVTGLLGGIEAVSITYQGA